MLRSDINGCMGGFQGVRRGAVSLVEENGDYASRNEKIPRCSCGSSGRTCQGHCDGRRYLHGRRCDGDEEKNEGRKEGRKERRVNGSGLKKTSVLAGAKVMQSKEGTSGRVLYDSYNMVLVRSKSSAGVGFVILVVLAWNGVGGGLLIGNAAAKVQLSIVNCLPGGSGSGCWSLRWDGTETADEDERRETLGLENGTDAVEQ
jgi:hypothetical protein